MKFALSSAGVAQIVQSKAPGPVEDPEAWFGGAGYNGIEANGTLDFDNATDVPIAGSKYRKDGYLILVDATAGLPANTTTVGGIAISSTQRVCYTTDAPAASDMFIGGMAVTQDGRIRAVLI